MRRLKIAYQILIAGISLLAFFGAPIPKDSQSVLKVLTFADAWVQAHAAFPGIFVLALALLIGTVVVPELVRLIGRQLTSNNPKPDIAIYKALDYIVNSSRAIVQKSSPPRVMEFGPFKGKIAQQVGAEHADAVGQVEEKLINGEINVWGYRELSPGSKIFDNVLRPIDQKYWEVAKLNSLSCLIDDAKKVDQTVIMDFSDGPVRESVYSGLMLNNAQIRRAWRPKSFIKRMRKRGKVLSIYDVDRLRIKAAAKD